jgi:voltage-gated potassium channel
LTVFQGDATDDAILQAAGIDKARTLIVCMGNNTTNLYIVLSARVLNPELIIIARGDTASESKMLRAGADRVISPYQISGKYMANIALRPHVTNFLDVVTVQEGIELWLEELNIEADSALVGQTVGQVDVRRRTGVTLVAILRRDQSELLTPDADTHLEAGDRLIVLGSGPQLAALGSLANGG